MKWLIKRYRTWRLRRIADKHNLPDIKLNALHVDELGVKMRIEHPMAHVLMDSMAEMFDSMGGENFVVVEGISAKHGKMIITLQKATGRTVEEKYMELYREQKEHLNE